MDYNVAISFASEDAWVAKDLYNLLSRYGLSVYCSEKHPDATANLMLKKLYDIYQNSTLNILIWSSSYDSKGDKSPVLMENNVLFTRHIGFSDHASLLIINIDDHVIPIHFGSCLSHSIKKLGIVEISEFAVSRIIKCWRCKDEIGTSYTHPPNTNRKHMEPFKFTIKESFKNETRWKTLGDIRVVPVNKTVVPKKMKIFLLPSGDVPIFLSHSNFLRTREDLLVMKQNAGEIFAKNFFDKTLSGVIFGIEKTINYPHAYCHEYDQFLCNWECYQG